MYQGEALTPQPFVGYTHSHVLDKGWYVTFITNKKGLSHAHRHPPPTLEQIRAAMIIVGTSCAGTGLDLACVKHVIIVGLPYFIDQCLQWAGRSREGGTVTVIVTDRQMREPNEVAGDNEGAYLCDVDS
jgi:Helicase conserved C-terminal domain